GMLEVRAGQSKDQSTDEASKIIGETLKGIVAEPPTKDEVERVKTRLLRAIEQQQTDAQQIGLGLSTPISQGDWRLQFLEYDRVRDVNPEDLVRVAKAYIKDSNLTVGVFIAEAAPDRAAIPETPDLNKAFAGFKGNIAVSRAEEFDPTPANIERRL